MTKHGLLYLLERSAELLERSAEEIKIAHTIGGRWSQHDEHGAHRDYKELRKMAKGLRKAYKYHKPNPIGGPAKMFDAIADRIRAGDSMNACMADYGLKFKRSTCSYAALLKRRNDGNRGDVQPANGRVGNPAMAV